VQNIVLFLMPGAMSVCLSNKDVAMAKSARDTAWLRRMRIPG
jgi:hypothetical protein